MNVAKFLDQSTLHSTRLQNAFKALATVKVYSNQRRAGKKFMEYHFKALPVNTMLLLKFFAILIFRFHSRDSEAEHGTVSRFILEL